MDFIYTYINVNKYIKLYGQHNQDATYENLENYEF
jgi:hypothetical protein